MKTLLLVGTLVATALALPAPMEKMPPKVDVNMVNVMRECKAVGDPHYTSFDGADIDIPTHNLLARMHGTFLMAGTCDTTWGTTPLTVWLTTKKDGYTTEVEIRTKKDGIKFELKLSTADVSTCKIDDDSYERVEFPECKQMAANHNINIIWNPDIDNSDITVQSMDGLNMQEWKLVAYAADDVFSAVHLYMRDSLYKGHVRGICGDMDGNANDDAYCWTPDLTPAECWDGKSLTVTGVNWRHGHRPSTCPKLYKTAWSGLSSDDEKKTKDTASLVKEEVARVVCAPILDTKGPFAACLSETERRSYESACTKDEAVETGKGCVAMHALVAHCGKLGGVQVDLATTACAAK